MPTSSTSTNGRIVLPPSSSNATSVNMTVNEVVSERPRGAPSLAELFVISPSVGAPEISWRRTRVAVSPPGGFRRNTTYSIELRPGLTDLSNNADTVGHRITFSTGAAIASGSVAGRVFDWAAARPAPDALMEAIALPDSGRYVTRADSGGLFTLRNLPPGSWLAP